MSIFLWRIVAAGFFIVAGVNHFVMPEFYLPLIPDYLPYPVLLNALSGLWEIVAGVGLLFTKYRRSAGWALQVLLLLFISSHIYFIQQGACVYEGLCVPMWVAWLRLLLLHPLIMWLVWRVSAQ
ncbi:hypothetical protein A3SI_04492 [Nitritalea halalkaliphila LW7]|uniref:DoxX family protein n=1 Tax=Nitritalea halalkaliphila LW7 TaxID=1189621 RepID=I5C8A1_9BACT|nr:DoxX family membrane protein [Nitritalea halalkaliphila]EIM78053.1 hypothetical protein A3SI_04492 [Nitritalea halalkaliphila LW7]